MKSEAAVQIDPFPLKNALLLSTAEPGFTLFDVPFKMVVVDDKLAAKLNKPVSITLDALEDVIVIAMELDQLVEFCSSVPSAAEALQSSIESGSLLVEFFGAELWDTLGRILGTHIKPTSLIAGNKTRPTNLIHARITSSLGHDFPISMSCGCKKSINLFGDILSELDPGLESLARGNLTNELISGRIFAGMMDAPRTVVSTLQVGDAIEVTNHAAAGIDGIMLLSDASALPVRLHPNYLELVAGPETTKLLCNGSGLPYLSEIGSAPDEDETRLGFLLARCSFTLKEMRQAMANGGMGVTLLEGPVLVCEGQELAHGHLVDADDATKFVVDRLA